MVANKEPIFVLSPRASGYQFDDGDTTTITTVFTAGAEGSRVDQIQCCTNDTAAINFAFHIKLSGGSDMYIGNVNVPIGSGYTTVAIVDAIATLAPSLGYIPLPANAELRANCVATMTAAKVAYVECLGGDY